VDLELPFVFEVSEFLAFGDFVIQIVGLWLCLDIDSERDVKRADFGGIYFEFAAVRKHEAEGIIGNDGRSYLRGKGTASAIDYIRRIVLLG
jgi:hypothetical protein